MGRHHRHLLELASLLATAGLADAFADVFGTRRHGPGALVGLGAALIAGTIGHHLWLRRTDHAPPSAAPASAAVFGTASAAGAPAGASSGRVAGTTAADPGFFWLLRTRVDDTPGRLAVLAGALAAAGANIHKLEAHPAPTGVIDEFLVETPQASTADQLCDAMRAVGGRDTTAVPAGVLALLDAPTRALELAGRLDRDPGFLEAALAELLGAREVALCTSEPGNADAWIDGALLVLRRADGATYSVSRPGVPFTATELSRARALADLARSAHPAAEPC